MKTERLHWSGHHAVAPGELPSSGSETAGARRAAPTFFVYFLQSEIAPKTYVGFTTLEHPELRVAQHNKGSNAYTGKHKPWKLIGYMCVETESQARALEAYFKTGAGRAFLSKYVIRKD